MDATEPPMLLPEIVGNLGHTAASANGYIPTEELYRGIASYERVVESMPGNYLAREGLALLYMLCGEEAKAMEHFETVTQQCHQCVTAWYQVAMIGQKSASLWKAMQTIRDVLESDAKLPPSDGRRLDVVTQARMMTFLATLLDKTGFYEEAFDMIQQVKSIHVANNRPPEALSVEVFVKGVDSVLSCESRDAHMNLAARPMANRNLPFLQSVHNGKTVQRQMVFVVGLPRTGATLVQQILSMASQVFSVGESNFIGDTMKLVDEFVQERGSSCRLDILSTQAAFDELTDIIVTKYSSIVPPSATVVVDKSVLNILHIGIIKLIFPDAKIIICKRNVKDAGINILRVLSLMGVTRAFHFFTPSFSIRFLSAISQYFSQVDSRMRGLWYDLAEMPRVVDAFQNIVEHWGTLQLQDILEVRYEDLIYNQETVTKMITSFIGFSWDPAFLEFQRGSHLVQSSKLSNLFFAIFSAARLFPYNFRLLLFTGSQTQDRRRLTQKSIGRWEHYAPFIDSETKRLWERVVSKQIAFADPKK